MDDRIYVVGVRRNLCNKYGGEKQDGVFCVGLGCIVGFIGSLMVEWVSFSGGVVCWRIDCDVSLCGWWYIVVRVLFGSLFVR